MGKKRRAEKVIAEAEVDIETKPVRVDLLPGDHGALRRVAADEGMSMAALARKVISEYARERDPRSSRR